MFCRQTVANPRDRAFQRDWLRARRVSRPRPRNSVSPCTGLHGRHQLHLIAHIIRIETPPLIPLLSLTSDSWPPLYHHSTPTLQLRPSSVGTSLLTFVARSL
jgi:hypothetical protein